MFVKLLRSVTFAKAPDRKATTSHEAPDAVTLLAPSREALEGGRVADALRLVDAVLNNHYNLADAHLLRARILHQQGDFEAARDSYTLAIHFAPDSSANYFNFGLLELDQGRFSEGVALLLRALQFDTGQARVHNALGAAYLRQGKFDEAIAHLRRAIALQPDLAEAHSNLGYVLFREMEEFELGTSHIENAIKHAPSNVAALCNWTMVLQQRGRFDEALGVCDKLLSIDPSLHEARVNRALILLTQGDFVRGWRDYEARKKAWSTTFSEGPPCAEWDGSDLSGKTIYVQAEQGIGDEIMFASCLPELIEQAQACTVECTPKLEGLFRMSFPRARVVRKNAWGDVQPMPDYKVAIGSLPGFCRKTLTHFPWHRGYLRAEPDRVVHWRERLAALPGTKKIGISWRGGFRSTRRAQRSIPLRKWLPVLSLSDIDFVSLQYGECRDDLAELGAMGVRIEHWQDAIDDYAETAALVSALDMVVSVQTAVVHLAGALGKPVWALISAVPEWRYGRAGQEMPWYPSVRLIRQSESEEWDTVLVELATALSNQSWK